MPFQGVTGWGGRHRFAPTGGAAYGMPSHSLTVPLLIPCTTPAFVCTVSGSDALTGAGQPTAARAQAETAKAKMAKRFT
jgi:hypothetical protein